MTSGPPKWEQIHPGDAASAQRVLGALRGREEPWSTEDRVAALWQLRRTVGGTSPERGRRGWTACLAGGLLAAAAALTVVIGALDSTPPVSTAAKSPGRANGAPMPATRSSWVRLELPDLGLIETSNGEILAIQELPGERQIHVESGEFRAQMVHQDPDRPAVVVTPHLRIVVVGTRFDVTVTREASRVEVIEGKVRVEAGDASVLVGAGLSVESDDVRLSLHRDRPAEGCAASPDPSPFTEPVRPARVAPIGRRAARFAPAPSPCEPLRDPGERRSCFELASAGNDLAAQNALYALAVMARDDEGDPGRAADLFDAYVQRFPSGPLGPEAALGRLEALQAEGRIAEAIEAARQFERQFAADRRAPEVALLRAALLCRDSSARHEAMALIERLATRPDPALQVAVERARRRCARDESAPSEARGPGP